MDDVNQNVLASNYSSKLIDRSAKKDYPGKVAVIYILNRQFLIARMIFERAMEPGKELEDSLHAEATVKNARVEGAGLIQQWNDNPRC